MIEPFVESIVSLADAARLCPRRRGGKRPHISCLYRWTVDGCRGVVLECVQIGGTRCTSHEALARFFERLTSQSRGNDSLLSPVVKCRCEPLLKNASANLLMQSANSRRKAPDHICLRGRSPVPMLPLMLTQTLELQCPQ